MKFEPFGKAEIPFSDTWSKVAISLSGGADSALLASFICDLVMSKAPSIEVHVISHIRMWKTRPWQQYDSRRVFDWFVQRYPSIKFIRHTNLVAPDIEYGNNGASIVDEYGKTVSGDNAQIRSYAEFVCFHNGIDAYFNAVTKNPENVDFSGLHTRDIIKNTDNQHLEFMIHMDKVVSHPFRFIDKSWVISQYIERDLLDLLNITRSCEGEFQNIDYRNYIPGQYVPVCNNCFWCKERNWALKENGF
jgi:hypothetical protein